MNTVPGRNRYSIIPRLGPRLTVSGRSLTEEGVLIGSRSRASLKGISSRPVAGSVKSLRPVRRGRSDEPNAAPFSVPGLGCIVAVRTSDIAGSVQLGPAVAVSGRSTPIQLIP